MTTYIKAADTAKLIRQALKESFPGIKFGVRTSTYSGGASIDVTWTDGPNAAQVGAIAKAFQGAYFDGMIDYQGSNYHTLDGEEVRFLANYVFTERQYSDAAIARAAERVVALYGVNTTATTLELVQQYRRGELWRMPLREGDAFDAHWNVQERVNGVLGKHSDRLSIHASATMDRLRFLGDDGYGAGTVGMPEDRTTGKGYPRTTDRVVAAFVMPAAEAMQ